MAGTTCGDRCAAILVAMNLGFDTVVRAPVCEVGLTHDEAVAAACAAGGRTVAVQANRAG